MTRELIIELIDEIEADVRSALAEGNWKRIVKLAAAAANLDRLLSD